MSSVPIVSMDDYEKQGSLHEMFIRQAKETPDNIAVVTYDGKKVTYKELDEMSDLLSKKLQKLGVKPNTIVGILMERCLEYAVSYIGIHKAGGAYLPLEVSYPQPLLEMVLKDSKLVAICTKTAFKEKLINAESPILLLENDWVSKLREEVAQSMFPPWIKVSLDDMAYTVYSSGSTGRPKGILCPHRGAVFSYHWRHEAFPYGEDEREACNIFFVWEMLRPLCKGVPLYIIPDDVIYDPPKLVKFLQDQKITRMLFTPSLMQTLVDYEGLDLQAGFATMRQIWFCGEVVLVSLRNKVAKLLPWVQLLNLYSVSECHDVSCADISRPSANDRGNICSVGPVLPGVHVTVMDENFNVKLLGESGELFVGGPTLALGYLNLPEMNTLRFIPRPPSVSTEVGPRLYRTGDWGFASADGSFEIHGRCDSMVKIRGYSIELQAVEVTLQELPMVSCCCVLAKGAEGSDKILVAYVAFNPGHNSSSKDLKNALKKKLPFYMIPSIFIILDRVPILEASGKLDKKALPEVLLKDNFENFVDVSLSSTERRIAEIWCRILRVYTIDVEESFFDLGGHSLLAAQFIGKINEVFNVAWSVSDLYLYPTIKSIAGRLENTIETNDLKVDLTKEVQSYCIPSNELDAKLRVFRRSYSLSKSKFKSCNVLLTGGTGFVGIFILDQLLKASKTNVYCLIRESPNVTPMQRIEETFKQYNINIGTKDSQFLDRIIPVKGDITLENFGLSEDDYIALSHDIDLVIHSAAQVNLVFPYHVLHRANVVGTRNIISFCVQNKIKPLHYVSTNDVFPSSIQDCPENGDMFQYADKLHSGYAQTKWVAEQSVLAASNCGIPTVIYRCGNVAGARSIPGWNPADLTFLILRGVLVTGCAPNIDWKIELTPVDFISKFIVLSAISFNESNGKIFHLVNRHSYSCRELWTLLNEVGYEVQEKSFNEWTERVKAKSNVCTFLKPLCHVFESLLRDEKYLTQQSSFSKINTTNFLNSFNLVYPEVNNELLSMYLENLARVSLIPPKKLNPSSSSPDETCKNMFVKNKIILVTGASSGIGSGIAQHLALAGAKVVLAARRVDRLNALKEQLRILGATVHTIQMDVTDEKQVATSVEEIEDLFGPIDVLINNAGVMYYTLMSKACLDQWQHTVRVNCNGVLNCLAAVLPRMLQRSSGHIINISSDAGRRPFAGLAVYSGSKHFVEALSGAMRSEICKQGVKVTCIQPGDVESELRLLTTDTEVSDMYDGSKTMEILKPIQIAEAVLFALSQPKYSAVNEILIEPIEAPL